jgi:hypothetical protein
MCRAGRRRKAGPRHANGRLIRDAIGATPEIALKRAVLAGPDGDETKTSNPLDLMALHHVIDRDTTQAATWFTSCAAAVLGPPWRKNILNCEPLGSEMSEARRQRLTNEYLAAIQGLDRGERDSLIDVLYFRRMPFWLLSHIAGRQPRRHELAERTIALAALVKLTKQWLAFTRAARRPARPRVEEPGGMLVAAE